MIEKADIDVDAIDGPHGEPITQAHLQLTGEFEPEIQRYFERLDEGKSPVLSIQIDGQVMDELLDALKRTMPREY